jgi:hypothetical protein
MFMLFLSIVLHSVTGAEVEKMVLAGSPEPVLRSAA